MHEVWVPTEFHRSTFAQSGVQPSKLVVVPEAVDGRQFNPARHEPLQLPLGERVFGPEVSSEGKPFVFLSIFKWEARKVNGALGWAAGKTGLGTACPNYTTVPSSPNRWHLQGWDLLLRAFLLAFTTADNVVLLLSTKPFHSDDNFTAQMQVGCGDSH
jgi:hypothetical protein